MNSTQLPKFTTSDLAMFSGSDEFFRNRMTGAIYTQGCKFLEDRGCAWMISDILVVCKMHPKVRREEFVSIRVKCDTKTGQGVISYGNKSVYLFSQKYVAMDCPVEDIAFFFTNNTLMLPGEA